MVNTQSCKKKGASSFPESSQWIRNNPILSRTLYQSFFYEGFSKFVDKHNHLRKLRRVFKLSLICICPLHCVWAQLRRIRAFVRLHRSRIRKAANRPMRIFRSDTGNFVFTYFLLIWFLWSFWNFGNFWSLDFSLFSHSERPSYNVYIVSR